MKIYPASIRIRNRWRPSCRMSTCCFSVRESRLYPVPDPTCPMTSGNSAQTPSRWVTVSVTSWHSSNCRFSLNLYSHQDGTEHVIRRIDILKIADTDFRLIAVAALCNGPRHRHLSHSLSREWPQTGRGNSSHRRIDHYPMVDTLARPAAYDL